MMNSSKNWQVCLRAVLLSASIALALSPISVVYPIFPFDKSVVTIENGEVVYHPLGAWRSSYTYWVDCDGGIKYKFPSIAIRATDGNIIGVARLDLVLEFDVLKLCSDPDTPSNFDSSWLKSKVSVNQWGFLKAWVNAGMPDGEARKNLTKEYFGHLEEDGVIQIFTLSFDPTVNLLAKSNNPEW